MKDLDIRRNGTIYHKGLKRLLKLHDDGRGYLCFSYKGKTHKLHRVIANKFCKRKHKSHTCVLHKNHKKHDCRASNLMWGTLSDNLKAAHKAGNMGHSRRKKKILGTMNNHEGGSIKLVCDSINQAAFIVNTSRANIGSVLKGKSRTAAGYTWIYV